MINFETIKAGDKVRLTSDRTYLWPAGTIGTVHQKDYRDSSIEVRLPVKGGVEDTWWFLQSARAGSGESFYDIEPVTADAPGRPVLTLEPVGEDGWLILMDGARYKAFSSTVGVVDWLAEEVA